MSRDPHSPPPPTPPSAPPTTAAVATVCTSCCSDGRWFLHNVRLRGVCRKLCTSCVLKLYPTSFCPSCFSLHDQPPISAAKTLTCFKCSSLSHSTCVPPNAPRSPYLCFLCSNPNFKFFDVRKPLSKVLEGGEEERRPGQAVDERAAKVLVAAAKIAALSMSKAAASARAEADKRVREAALARKRAKEAIDYVTSLSARISVVVGNKREVSAVVPVAVSVGIEKNGGRTPAPEIKNVDRSGLNNGPVAVVVTANLNGNNHGGGGGGGGKDGK